MKSFSMFRKLSAVFVFANTIYFGAAQNVLVTDDAGYVPDSNAILDIKSNSKGILLPRLSDSQRDSLCQDLPAGLLIFNTSDNNLQMFLDGKWYPLSLGNPETPPPYSGMGTVVDYDGNKYFTVVVGEQEWMASNLRLTHYSDGTPIQKVEANEDWAGLTATSKAFCWYQNDSLANAEKYGALYSWAAAMNGLPASSANPSGVQGICPTGWHVPSVEEWNELNNFIGSQGFLFNEGIALKAKTGWNHDGNGTDNFYFIGLPAGIRNNSGYFYDLGDVGYWWTTNEASSEMVSIKYLIFDENVLGSSDYLKKIGFSVRCIKD